MRKLWNRFRGLTWPDKVAIVVIVIAIAGGAITIAGKISAAYAGKTGRETGHVRTTPKKPTANTKQPKEAKVNAEVLEQVKQWNDVRMKLSDLVGDGCRNNPNLAIKALSFSVGCSIYQVAQRETDTATAESNEISPQQAKMRYLFAMDVLKSLKLCADSRQGKIDASDGVETLKTLYSGREKLFEAKSIIKVWENSEDVAIAESAGNLLHGLNDWVLAAELLSKALGESEETAEPDAALGSAKLASGRETVFKSAFSVIYIISSERPYEVGTTPGRLYLTREQLDTITDFIEDSFRSEVNVFRSREAKRINGLIKEYSMPEEVWAALLLRTFILQRA